jgi:hypothetical protein
MPTKAKKIRREHSLLVQMGIEFLRNHPNNLPSALSTYFNALHEHADKD